MLLKLALIIALSMNALAAGAQPAVQNSLSERPKPFAESHEMLKSADFHFLPYDLPVYMAEASNYLYYTPALRLIVEGSGPNEEIMRNYLSESGESCATEGGCSVNRVQLFLQRVNQREVVDAIKRQLDTKDTKKDPDPLSGKYWLTSGEKYGESVLKTEFMSVGVWSTDSPVPVSFTVASWEEAEDFIENLERGNDVLQLHYVFSGVSTNYCQAAYTSEAKSAILVHEDRNSDAEWVSLKRTSDIAEQASKSTHVELTCEDDPVRTARLREMVESHLAAEAGEGGKWVNWTDAESVLSPTDASDFATNIIGNESFAVEKVDGTSIHIDDESMSASGGTEICVRKFCLRAEGAYADNDIESGDMYFRNGVAYSREQSRYVPQKIGVYRRDAVRHAIDTLATYSLGSKDAVEGEGMVTLGRQSWVREDAGSPLYSAYESILDDLTEIKACFLKLDEIGTTYVNLGHKEFDTAWAQRQRSGDSAMIHRDKENGRWMLLTGSGSQAIVHFARGAQVARSTRFWSRDIGDDSTRVSCL